MARLLIVLIALLSAGSIASAQSGADRACMANERQITFRELIEFARSKAQATTLQAGLASTLGLERRDLAVSRYGLLLRGADTFRALDLADDSRIIILIKRTKGHLDMFRLNAAGKIIGASSGGKSAENPVLAVTPNFAEVTQLCDFFFEIMRDPERVKKAKED